MWFILQISLTLPLIIQALPFHQLRKHAAVGFAASAGKPLFSLDNGDVGVDFGGYHASAGLGGVLTGDAADGGLHASAGTPFGQSAGAGLGGTVDGAGNISGASYVLTKGLSPANVFGISGNVETTTTQDGVEKSEVETFIK